MLKVKISYADGYSEVVAVDAPNQRDAVMLALRHANRNEIDNAKRHGEATSAKCVGSFEQKSDDHLRDLNGRW